MEVLGQKLREILWFGWKLREIQGKWLYILVETESREKFVKQLIFKWIIVELIINWSSAFYKSSYLLKTVENERNNWNIEIATTRTHNSNQYVTHNMTI